MHPERVTVALDDPTDARTEEDDDDRPPAVEDGGQRHDGVARPAVPDDVDGLRVDEGGLARQDGDGVARPDGSDLRVDEGAPPGPSDGTGDAVAIRTVGGPVDADGAAGDGDAADDIAVPAERALSGNVELVDDTDGQP